MLDGGKVGFFGMSSDMYIGERGIILIHKLLFSNTGSGFFSYPTPCPSITARWGRAEPCGFLPRKVTAKNLGSNSGPF